MVKEDAMLDFLIDLLVELADVFIDLWTNKIFGKKKKKEKDNPPS